MTPVTLFDLDPDRLDRTQLPLYDRLIIEFAGPERRSAEGKWLTGTIIHFVRENQVYKDHGFQTDPQWIKATFPFDVDQADRYVQIAELPRPLLVGVEADVHRLVAVRQKDPVFWPSLIKAAGQGVTEAMLTKAARAGKAHLMLHKNVEAACAHVLAVDLCPEEQQRDGLLDRPGRPTETPAATKSSVSKNAGLASDKAGSTESSVSKNAGLASDKAGSTSAAFLKRCTQLQRGRPPCSLPSLKTLQGFREKAKGDNDLNQKSRIGAPEQQGPSAWQRAPACPDPCPLCQGMTEQGPLRHRLSVRCGRPDGCGLPSGLPRPRDGHGRSFGHW